MPDFRTADDISIEFFGLDLELKS